MQILVFSQTDWFGAERSGMKDHADYSRANVPGYEEEAVKLVEAVLSKIETS
jgi:hypothetical protein